MNNEQKPLTAEEWDDICHEAGLPNDSVRYSLSEIDMRRVAAYAVSIHTAAIREELARVQEAKQGECDDAAMDYADLNNEIKTLTAERDEATCRVREANDLLQIIQDTLDYGPLSFVARFQVKKEINEFLSCRPSIETKPASPWISVKERLPNHGQRIIAVRDFTLWGSEERRAFEGVFYRAQENTRHGGPRSLVPPGIIPKGSYYWAFPCIDPPEVVTHWMPIPAIPESSTSAPKP